MIDITNFFNDRNYINFLFERGVVKIIGPQKADKIPASYSNDSRSVYLVEMNDGSIKTALLVESRYYIATMPMPSYSFALVERELYDNFETGGYSNDR